MSLTRSLRRAAAATTLSAAVCASAAAPANAWENTFDESVGNEGQCTLEFTEQEREDINAAYGLMFGTMADLSYERINDLKDRKVWWEWAKETDQKDLTAPGPLGPVTNAQVALFAGKDSGTYTMAARYLEQSRKEVVPSTELTLTPAEAADLKGAGAVNTGSLVAPGIWALMRGSLSVGDVTTMAGEALNKLGPRIQPTIKSYENALTACEERESTKGTIKQGSSLDTDQFAGLVAGGVLGGLALLGLIAVAAGPLVNDFFTNFWRNAGVLR
ncbi:MULTISPECIES: hypothetical protein [unclassified Corynebacterium]|uniref:hypothetical protein n=1 Tax=unclassified Corynebacterium TaxID=2624378 RepID=UPI0021AA87E1|nr:MULTISPECIES: hypothetical protein [unclassified Corynebacterium]MCT1452097.1 hypothetical protein [Corynebacterium sp. p3-SID1145]MCT1461799.1 hypothetical protein [Corynebacterium sp. p3-SID1140]MDN8595206.1 hypothetical protein [Corynebacterium sp. P4_F2]WKK55334.1 hypothetical protein QYR03_09070 [Corynebacterium sp. P4-C1]WKK62743.1 hypothetical protein QYR04_07770 [Corynebacterium sp. P8-C1]